jgi:anti-anti-sigma factor
MTELVRVNIERHEHSIVARFQGEVDASNVYSLERDTIAAVPHTCLGLVLELSEVDYIDSSGVRMLFTLDHQLRERGQRMRAVVPETTPIKEVLDCLGVGTVIPLDTELPAALAQLAQ